MATCRELIIDAYHMSGVRGTNESVTADDTSFALRILNTDVIDQLRIDSAYPAYVKTYEFQTQNSKWDYTIGVPQTGYDAPDIVVSQQIVQIEWAQCQIGTVWTPMRQISNSDYYRQTIPQGSNVVPSQFAYNKVSDPYDRFMLSLGASGVYNIRLACNGIVSNYLLDDVINLPSGYYATLKYALAQLIAEGNGLTETADRMGRKYSDCLHRITLVNSTPAPKLKLDGSLGQYSIGVDKILSPSQGI